MSDLVAVFVEQNDLQAMIESVSEFGILSRVKRGGIRFALCRRDLDSV